MDLMRYETAGSKRKGGGAVETKVVEIAWYVAGGLSAVVVVIGSMLAFYDFQSGLGWLLLLCAPFAALGPVTVGLGLRRSARIERALDQLVARKDD